MNWDRITLATSIFIMVTAEGFDFPFKYFGLIGFILLGYWAGKKEVKE